MRITIIQKTVRKACFSKYENSCIGHVFEKRYYDKIIPTKQGMLEVSRYIHLNPVAAKMVAKPEEYPWSSYRYYLHTLGTGQLNVNVVLDYFSGNEREKRVSMKPL